MAKVDHDLVFTQSLEKIVAEQQEQIQRLRVGLEKVNAQLQQNGPPPALVSDD